MLVGQPKLLKEVNRDIIKDLIFQQGPITKPELTRKTNLSLPTVNKIVDGLEADGIIRQDGTTGSTSGKKAKVYVANEKFGNIIVLYYLEGYFRGYLVNAVGSVIRELSEPVDATTGETALKAIWTLIEQLKGGSEASLRAIGIGVPGAVKSDKRITNITAIPGWNNLKLEELVAEHCGVPVFVENDVKLTTVGYYHAHLEKTCKDMIYLYIGKGIGSGVIIDGGLHKGFSSFAGEFGYLAPFEGGESDEYAQGGGWFEDKLQGLLYKENRGDRTEDRAENKTENRTEEKTEAVTEDMADAVSAGVSPKYIRYIAVGMIGYIVTINPEVMVLQGKWFHEETVQRIKEELKRFIPEESMPQILVNRDEFCGVNGLINFCLSGLSTTKELVRKRSI